MKQGNSRPVAEAFTGLSLNDQVFSMFKKLKYNLFLVGWAAALLAVRPSIATLLVSVVTFVIAQITARDLSTDKIAYATGYYNCRCGHFENRLYLGGLANHNNITGEVIPFTEQEIHKLSYHSRCTVCGQEYILTAEAR